MDREVLKDIMKRRDEIMNKSKNDEYIQVPDDNDTRDSDDVSLTEYFIKYNFGKDIRNLTQTVKLYLQEQNNKKNSCSLTSYFLTFLGVSGLIVFNDYILINYIF